MKLYDALANGGKAYRESWDDDKYLKWADGGGISLYVDGEVRAADIQSRITLKP